MSKLTAKLEIEIEFEPWFSDGREPKNKQDWNEFFMSHFMPESMIVGIDDGEVQEMIDIEKMGIQKITITKLKDAKNEQTTNGC